MDRLTARNKDGTAYYPKCFEKCDGAPQCNNILCNIEKQICEKLAAYEDTGLSPEQVAYMAENAETRLLAWFESRHSMPVGRLMELCEADEDGRVVVLAAKPGSKVYLLKRHCKYAGDKNEPWGHCNQYWDNVYKRDMWGCAGKDDDGNAIECEKREMIWRVVPMEYSIVMANKESNLELGRDLFLTREAAEKALEEAKGDG